MKLTKTIEGDVSLPASAEAWLTHWQNRSAAYHSSLRERVGIYRLTTMISRLRSDVADWMGRLFG